MIKGVQHFPGIQGPGAIERPDRLFLLGVDTENGITRRAIRGFQGGNIFELLIAVFDDLQGLFFCILRARY